MIVDRVCVVVDVFTAVRWMEACLHEELPAPTELEEALRNGVYLAKLGHCFAPDVVPLKKIYDTDQERYKVNDVHTLLLLDSDLFKSV